MLEVLVAADFTVLHVEKAFKRILGEWSINFLHELWSILFYFFDYLVDILFNRKKVSLYSLLFKELDVWSMSLLNKLWPYNQSRYLFLNLSQHRCKDEV